MDTTKGIAEEAEAAYVLQSKYSNYGIYSFVAIVAILFAFTLYNGVSYPAVLRDIWQLFSQGTISFQDGNSTSTIDTITYILAVMLMAATAGVGSSKVAEMLVGKAKSVNYKAFEEILDKGPWMLLFTVTFEELISRGLFMGLFLNWLGGGKFAFWAMFIAMSIVFVAMHYGTYKDKKERSWVRFIPQFIGGVVLTFIYLKYGMLVTILVHFYYDVILFSSLKEEKPEKHLLKGSIYYFILVAISLLLANVWGLQLSDLAVWITSNDITPLPGYTFWHYLVMLVLVGSTAGVLSKVFLLDQVTTQSKDFIDNMARVEVILVTIVLTFGILYILNVVLSLDFMGIESAITRALIATILLSLMGKSYSGSSLANQTLLNLPETFILVASISVLGFWTALALTAIYYCVNLPATIITLRK